MGQLLSGAVITEQIFAYPGVGRLAIDAISTRDFPVVQANVIFVSVVVVALSLLVDMLYLALDPRIRYT
jgi:peptide/nickel transport system permease protein